MNETDYGYDDAVHQVKTFDKPKNAKLLTILVINKLKEKRNSSKSASNKQKLQKMIGKLESDYKRGKYIKENKGRHPAMFTQTFDKLLKKQTKGKSPKLRDLERVFGLMRKRYKDFQSDNPHMAESVNESRANVLKAIAIAKKMSGNMTGAVKKIEKIQKGLSTQIEVEDALRKANESVNERMDKNQAGEMLKQLGGRKFIMMTGAKNFAVGPKGASFKIGRNSKNVNYVRIDLKNDLYDMEFIQMRAGKLKVKSKEKGVYADQLQKMFTKNTGMYTSL